MRIEFFPVNSNNSYVVFEDHDNPEDLKTFMRENNIFRIIFSGALGYGKSALPFDKDIEPIEEVLIQYSKITDLTPLYHLSNVKKLTIEGNPELTNPFDIRKMVGLTDFSTDNTLKTDGLFSHPTLLNLHIEPNKIKKPDIEKENNVLESLSIANSHNRI